MKKIYIVVGVIGAFVIGGGAYYILSGSATPVLYKLGMVSETKYQEFLSQTYNQKVIYVQIQYENGTFSSPQKCSYEINSSDISFEIKNGEGESATPTELNTKQVSDISIIQYQDSADHKSLRFQLTKDGADMYAKITEDAAKRGGRISIYINSKVISSPIVLDKITSDSLDFDLRDPGITKAQEILGKNNIRLTCPDDKATSAPATKPKIKL